MCVEAQNDEACGHPTNEPDRHPVRIGRRPWVLPCPLVLFSELGRA